jgi:superfamily II DNA or RNA helicase
MRIAIDSRVRVFACSPEEEAALVGICEHPNPALAERDRLEKLIEARPFDRTLKARAAQLRGEGPRIPTWRRDRTSMFGEHLSLPRGALDKILPRSSCADSVGQVDDLRDRISAFGEVDDERTDGDPPLASMLECRPLRLPDGFALRPYQGRNLARMQAVEQGILRSACGSGKSFTFLAFACAVGVPTIVAVWSRPLLDQWVKTAMRDLGLRPDEVGVLNDEVERVRPLTIAMVPTCVARGWQRKYARTFGALLCDEADGYAARTRIDFVDPFECRYRFAASDDERRKDEHEFWLYDLFGPVIDVVSRKEAEAAGAIVPVRVRLAESGFAPPRWWAKLAPAARAYQQNRLLREMATDPARSKLCADAVAEYVREGHQVLAFAHHVEHVRKLEADVRARLPGLSGRGIGLHLGGKECEDERRRTVAGLEAGGCRVALATYKSLGKGIDLPSVTREVLCTPIHNSPDTLNQTLGRLNRASDGKAGAEATVIYDEQISGLAPVRAYRAGGREGVVICADGRTVDARDYIAEREERRRGAATDFFRGL